MHNLPQMFRFSAAITHGVVNKVAYTLVMDIL